MIRVQGEKITGELFTYEYRSPEAAFESMSRMYAGRTVRRAAAVPFGTPKSIALFWKSDELLDVPAVTLAIAEPDPA